MTSTVFDIVQQSTEQRARCWKTRADDAERLLDCRSYGGANNGVCDVVEVNPIEANHPDDGGDACAAESVS